MLFPFQKKIFSTEEVIEIENAIREAEEGTSGEIRVHVDNFCKSDPLERAEMLFAEMRMHETELRNGILIYIAQHDRKFAIYGDKGIHEKVNDGFWIDIKSVLLNEFANGNFKKALIDAVLKSGVELKKYFPISENDKNELNNEVTFG